MARKMLTGFNTDVVHNDVVYHVQTEDKGVDNPLIESLVYVDGQVVATRRASYADLIANGSGERTIGELLNRQHKVVIAAIRSGRFDSRVASMGLTGRSRSAGTVAETAPEAADEATGGDAAPGGDSPSLDQVILDYLLEEGRQDRLVLQMSSDSKLVLGSAARLRFEASSGRTGEPVGQAEVSVKMISTVRSAVMLGSGLTGDDGRLELEIEIPPLERGTAALIIVADSSIGTAELKQLL